MVLASLVEINHILYILRESETKRNDGYTVHIVGDAFSFYSTSEEEPEYNESHKSCASDG